jgi:hypothetical protein
MRLREVFSIRTGGQELEIGLPIRVSLEDEERIEIRMGEGARLDLVIERTVDPLALSIENKSGMFEALSTGERRELPTLRVPTGGNVRAIDITCALTFLTDVALTANAAGSELVPENEEDEAALSALGTRRVQVDTTVLVSTRTFNPIVEGEALKALLPKTVGLRLYADAVALPTDVARFRELWRCLESAFGMKDARLVAAIADYPPAVEIGFDREEIAELHVLRGQLSHAESRAGLKELLRAGDAASRRVPRLKCLVERVILTKQNWGRRDLSVEELTPASAWIGPDGGIVAHWAAGEGAALTEGGKLNTRSPDP